MFPQGLMDRQIWTNIYTSEVIYCSLALTKFELGKTFGKRKEIMPTQFLKQKSNFIKRPNFAKQNMKL